MRQLRAAASCGESSNKPVGESSAEPAKPAKPSHESGRKQQSEKCFQQSEKLISKHQSQPIVEKELQNPLLLCLSQTQQ